MLNFRVFAKLFEYIGYCSIVWQANLMFEREQLFNVFYFQTLLRYVIKKILPAKIS